MTEISYFTEYSQRENQITNNTILMFRYVYNESPKLFNEFLCSLLDDNIDFGIKFSQQVKGPGSVPDALISQKASNIYFEFKPTDSKDENQIERHIKDIKQSDVKNGNILLYVTVNKIDNEKDYGLPVFFITYADIVENLESICPEYLYNLCEIIEDYRKMLENQGLLPIDHQMVSVPCGTTWEGNFKLKHYYQPINRSLFRKNTKYIGIYNDKKIKYIGRIEHTITVKNKTEIYDYYDTDKRISDPDITNRIKEIIEESPYNLSDEIYYLFDEIYEVNIQKNSKGGLPGRKYFDLLEDFNIEKDSFNDDFKELCNQLKGKSFK